MTFPPDHGPGPSRRRSSPVLPGTLLVLLVVLATGPPGRPGAAQTPATAAPTRTVSGREEAVEAGLRALREGRTPLAVSLLETATGTGETSSRDAWLGLGVAYGRLERWESAATCLARGRAGAPEPLAAWVDLLEADLLIRAGRPEAADSLLAGIVSRPAGGAVRERALTGRLELATGRDDREAAMALRRRLVADRHPASAAYAVELADLLKPTEPEAARDLLVAALELPGSDEARGRAARRLLEEGFDDAPTLLRAGRILHDISDWAGARAALEIAYRKGNSEVKLEAAYRLGMTHFRQKEWRAAVARLEEAGGSPRWRTAAAFYRAQAVAAVSDRASGAAALVGFADTYPHSRWTPRALRLAADRLGSADCSAARQVLTRLIQEHPTYWENAAALFQLGNCARRQQDRAEARRWYVRLGSGVFYPEEKAQGWYWAGRMALAEGDSAAARAYLERAADSFPGTWYGELAAAELGRPQPLRRQPPLDWVPPITLTVPEWADPELAAGVTLLRIGQEQTGEAALLESLDHRRLDRDRLYTVWERCVAGGAYDAAARLGERLRDDYRWPAGDQRRTNLEYPLYWLDRLLPHTARHDVDPLLVLALMKQESLYRSDARSFAGARGLLQLMPVTANEWAHRLRLPAVSAEDLYDPERNLALGVPYLARLIEQFGGSVPKALAAYNGGATNVRRWERGLDDERPETFLEAIGYEETRNYVRSVLNHYERYRRLWTLNGPG
jgi:soluble lytic murein transglycosylase-like protein